jgi:hypothetical protein
MGSSVTAVQILILRGWPKKGGINCARVSVSRPLVSAIIAKRPHRRAPPHNPFTISAFDALFSITSAAYLTRR